MNSTTRNPAILPLEIIIAIFSWLPVISLMRFKCASKFFNSLVSESYFMVIHNCRSMTRSNFILRKREGLYSIEQKEDGNASRWDFNTLYHYSALANGLFCLWEEGMTVRIGNYSTRQVIYLPRLRIIPHERSPRYYYSLGYEPQENKYKVLMTRTDLGGPIRNWIFTLNIDEEWRVLESTVDFDPWGESKICVRGVIYQMDHSNKVIIAFDLKAENFKVIRLANDARQIHYRLIEVKGKLALVDSYSCLSGQKDLWILEENSAGKEEWESHSMRLPLQWKGMEDKLRPFSAKSLCTSCDGEIVFIAVQTNSLACYYYDVRKNSWRYLQIQGVPTESTIYSIRSYVESLFSCQKVCSTRHQV